MSRVYYEKGVLSAARVAWINHLRVVQPTIVIEDGPVYTSPVGMNKVIVSRDLGPPLDPRMIHLSKQTPFNLLQNVLLGPLCENVTAAIYFCVL